MSVCCKSRGTRPIAGLEFSREDIQAAVLSGRLLSLELEMTHACNLCCLYCYSEAGRPLDGELTLGEIQDVIRQAAALGARKIVVLGGGEPLLFAEFARLVEFIRYNRLAVEVFTNGTLIDEATAQFLYRHGASVVVKRNAMNTAVQDALAGVPGTFERVERGLAALFKAGYPDAEHGLGIQTIICSLNYEKIPQLWSWARRHGIQPYFESMTVQGRASQHPELLVSAADLERMFRRLCELDREAFGIHWTPQPPLAGARCARHLFSMLVRANGDIWPCVGVSIAVGNVRQQRLGEILHTDPVLHDLRNIYTTIKGKCRTCELNGECYGCRGSAFQLTGDYLASDPRCWRNGTEMAG